MQPLTAHCRQFRFIIRSFRRVSLPRATKQKKRSSSLLGRSHPNG
jgi:hypothetical protein